MASVTDRPFTPIDSVLEEGSQCEPHELAGANEIKDLHDVIEIIAYRSFAEAVQAQNITKDTISERQSGKILAHVKKMAHIELYKEGGYWKERLKKLNPSQVQGVIRAVARVIHDRDTKLTDARYTSLTEMLMAFDDHNSEVKNVLLKSWYKSPDFSDNDLGHLNYVKQEAGFYPAMARQLSFNLEQSLAARSEFFDTFFPGLRNGVSDESQSSQFINVLEVRSYMGGSTLGRGWVQLNLESDSSSFEYCSKSAGYVNKALNGENPLDTRLVDILDEQDVHGLFQPRKCDNLVRRTVGEHPPLLSDVDMTVGQFLSKYFPEKLV